MSSSDHVRDGTEPYKFVSEEFENVKLAAANVGIIQQPAAGTRRRPSTGPLRLGLADEEVKSNERSPSESNADYRDASAGDSQDQSPRPRTATVMYAQGSKSGRRGDQRNDDERSRSSRSTRAGQESARSDRRRSSSRKGHDRSPSRSDQRHYWSKSSQRPSRSPKPRERSKPTKSEKKPKTSHPARGAGKKKQTGSKRAGPKPADQVSMSDTSEDPTASGGRVAVKNDVAALLRQYHEAGARSTTPRPHGMTPDVSDSERRVIRQCLDLWLMEPCTRVKPPTAGCFAVLDDGELRRRRQYTEGLFSSTDSWLREFDAFRVGDPGHVREDTHLVLLDDLGTIEQVAILQSVLLDAGFSFKNLVPGFDRHNRSKNFAPTTIQQAIFESRWAVGEEISRFLEVRGANPVAVATPPVVSVAEEAAAAAAAAAD